MTGPSHLDTRLRQSAAPETAQANDWTGWRDSDGVFWLYFDQAGSETNTLSEAVLGEFAHVLDRIAADPPQGLVIASAKPGGFIAGADVREFQAAESADAIREKVRRAHAVFDKLEGLPFPTVAMIHGYCMGGGLELALACRYRIAREDSALAFPEVMLGIYPGFGGTGRLTRLLPPLTAMEMMLSGRTWRARQARASGLVDAVTQDRHLADGAAAAALGRFRPRRRRSKMRALNICLQNSAALRPLLGWLLRRGVKKRVRSDHYPAPFALIDLWVRSGGHKSAMQRGEARDVPDLLTGAVAQNLIRVFFLRQRLKGLAKSDGGPVSHVHVIGAGTMGGDIAAWAARRGCTVTLEDREAKFIAPAMRRAGELFRRQLREPWRVRDALDRLIPDPAGRGVSEADLVIEAVPEKLDLKTSLFQRIEPRMKPDAILATNTSSLPLEELAQVLSRPERLIGLHFFNPVARMPLVEVVRGRQSGEAAYARALAFCHRADKLPLPTRSAPGFLVNRALMPYLLEAVTLLEEGHAAETIDQAALDYGMPMGPVELADTVGLDVCLSVADVLSGHFGGTVPARLRRLVEDGRLGRKSGQGFYSYRNGKPRKSRRAPAPPGDMAHRLLNPLVETCRTCVEEGIVEDADMADAGLIFGAGYAPFRGGPLHDIAERRREASGRE